MNKTILLSVLAIAVTFTASGQGIRGVTRKSLTSPVPGGQPSTQASPPPSQTMTDITGPLQANVPAPSAPQRFYWVQTRGSSPDPAETARKVVELQKKRAENGSPHDQYELGLRYLKGDGVETNEVLGRQWLKKAADNGHEHAAKKLAQMGTKQGEAPSKSAALAPQNPAPSLKPN